MEGRYTTLIRGGLNVSGYPVISEADDTAVYMSLTGLC